MKNPTKKDVLLWRDTINNHGMLKRFKGLKLDTKNCIMVLKSNAFSEIKMINKVDEDEDYYWNHFKQKISGFSILVKKYRSDSYKPYQRRYFYSANDHREYCFGGGKESFHEAMYRMTYLSEFLGVLPAFIGSDLRN